LSNVLLYVDDVDCAQLKNTGTVSVQKLTK